LIEYEKQSFEVSAFRFDGDDFRARTSGGSHKHRKQADIRTYIHKDKFALPRPCRIDFRDSAASSVVSYICG
jgi:hypothetical protein